MGVGHIFAAHPTPEPFTPARRGLGSGGNRLATLQRADAGNARHIGADAIGASVTRQQIFARPLGKTVRIFWVGGMSGGDD